MGERRLHSIYFNHKSAGTFVYTQNKEIIAKIKGGFMHKTSLFKSFSLTVSFFVLLVSFAHAGTVPQTFNYQGTLTDSSGNLIEAPPSPLLALTFRIYDSYTGGNLVWGPETHNNVMVKKGIFSVVFGNSVPVNETHFSGPDRYISVQVGADPEMSPRQKINSVPYALKAGDAIPGGVIVMWSGSINQIPAGWALCDGNNGTPDLRDRFIVGVGNSYTVGATGGSVTINLLHSHVTGSHALTIPEMPAHDHGGVTGTYPLVRLGNKANSGNDEPVASYQNTHSHTIPSQGGGVAHNHGSTGDAGNTTQDIRPPYYALAFIMKL